MLGDQFNQKLKKSSFTRLYSIQMPDFSSSRLRFANRSSFNVSSSVNSTPKKPTPTPPPKTHLIAGRAPGLQPLGVVPLAVDLAKVDAVGQVDEEVFALGALEAGGMPDHRAHPGRGHAYALHVLLAAVAGGAGGRVLRHPYVQRHLIAARYEVLEQWYQIYKWPVVVLCRTSNATDNWEGFVVRWYMECARD